MIGVAAAATMVLAGKRLRRGLFNGERRERNAQIEHGKPDGQQATHAHGLAWPLVATGMFAYRS